MPEGSWVGEGEGRRAGICDGGTAVAASEVEWTRWALRGVGRDARLRFVFRNERRLREGEGVAAEGVE